MLLPKSTLSSLLTWGIFWLPRNFSTIVWQSSQACPGTVCYQSTSGELSDHKRWQSKLRSHWPNHRADRRNAAGGDGVEGHWTLLNIIFLMCTFLRMAESGGMRTPAHSDCFLLLISCSNIDLHSKVLAINPPKRSIIPNSWWLEYGDNRNFWSSRDLETRKKKLQNLQFDHIWQR